MFADTLIDNDLAAIDAAICDYYGLNEAEEQPEQPEQPQQQGDAA